MKMEDTAQMVQIIQYAEGFYALDGEITTVIDAQFPNGETKAEAVEDNVQVSSVENVFPVSASNVMEEITKAKHLLDTGIMTEQEFTDLKVRLIAKL